ncbi:MAG TPA: S8 family serine peptidase [Chitinophagaceae bacterium]|nr:S8 family serine peptidase [Chitinophagaceae bacterium]
MKKVLLSFLLLMLGAMAAEAQFTRYVVRFKNKGNSSFTLSNPSAYLSTRAIQRRTKFSIAIDSTDLPVTPTYISQVAAISGVNVLNVSRWLNAITIQTSSAAAITAINALPFVQSVSSVAARNNGRSTAFFNKFESEEIFTPYSSAQRIEQLTADYFNYGTGSFNEIHLHNGEFLHNIGLRGQGMQIGMLDNGFNNYTNLKAFDSMNAGGQVLGTWDFVAREANVANDGSHGMSCLSAIVANIPGQFIGKAPKASFWLYQTEDNASEYPIEEFNWACGVERADSSGADVISSSLGYGYQFDGGVPDYPYSTLDGNTTMSAIAADLAAKKGLLVFVAAGNAGNIYWRNIITPADGDSVLAIGAVNTTGVVGSFSSYGPSGDGQIKPDIASVGVSAMVQSTSNTVVTGNGTSYACPNMAGLGTCLWQGFPEFNNMKIARALQQAGTRAANPDDRVGYGIPDIRLAFGRLLSEYATSSATVTGCRVTVSWNSKDISAMKYEIERKAPGETNYSKIAELSPQAGVLLTNRSYQINNDLVSGSSGTYSYRIRQVLDTATASFYAVYIDTANINIVSGCIVTGTNNPQPTGTIVSIQPNPVSGSSFSLIIETPYPVNNMPVLVYDSKGSLIMQLKESKTTGKKIIEIPSGKLAKGNYYIRVMNGEKLIGNAELLKL